MQLCRGCTSTLEGRELLSGLEEDSITPTGMGRALYTSMGALTKRVYSAYPTAKECVSERHKMHGDM